jgi:hypothetical protein
MERHYINRRRIVNYVAIPPKRRLSHAFLAESTKRARSQEL